MRDGGEGGGNHHTHIEKRKLCFWTATAERTLCRRGVVAATISGFDDLNADFKTKHLPPSRGSSPARRDLGWKRRRSLSRASRRAAPHAKLRISAVGTRARPRTALSLPPRPNRAGEGRSPAHDARLPPSFPPSFLPCLPPPPRPDGAALPGPAPAPPPWALTRGRTRG